MKLDLYSLALKNAVEAFEDAKQWSDTEAGFDYHNGIGNYDPEARCTHCGTPLKDAGDFTCEIPPQNPTAFPSRRLLENLRNFYRTALAETELRIAELDARELAAMDGVD